MRSSMLFDNSVTNERIRSTFFFSNISSLNLVDKKPVKKCFYKDKNLDDYANIAAR